MERRRFNGRERVALYLASGGKCVACGAELTPGWHADHKQAYAHGGATDVVNGQALCPTCNLKKGDKVVAQAVGASDEWKPRAWQIAAWTHYEAVNKRDFLCCACPGAGKTRWTLTLARRLLDNGTVKRVVIVAPSCSVRDQWIDQNIVHLEAVENKDGGRENTKDFEGCALTYAQVTINPDLQRKACYERDTLVIFDEIHHAGDEQAWGERLTSAFELATRRLGLTGTPWRRPKTGRIPFVTYDADGRICPDYEYSYGKAVADTPPVCRAIQFHAYDAQIQCVELELGTSTSVALSDLSDVQDRSHAMTAILDTQRDWMRAMLEKAQSELRSIRGGSVDDGAVPDAQGLVIADDQEHARRVKQLLEHMTGESPELIISDEPDAEKALQRFREGSQTWAVAVNKVSEGVDVASLYVGVYATRKVSPLLFRQIAGRFVRRRGDLETHDAVLFIPAVPDLVRLASEIEDEIRHEVELTLDEDENEREQMERERNAGEPNLEVWNTSDPRFKDVIRSGQTYSNAEYQAAEVLARKVNATNIDPIIIAALFRQNGTPLGQNAPVAASEPTTRHISRAQQKAELKRKLDKRVKAVAYEMAADIKSFNNHLAGRFGVRSSLSLDELKAELEYVEETLRKYRGNQ